MNRLINLEPTDVLSNVLGTLKLQGRVFCISELTAPWSLNLSPSDFAHFHVIERGGAWIKVGNKKALPLASGDLIIIPQGKGHTLSDSPTTRPVPIRNVITSSSAGCNMIRHGGGGAQTLMTCGSFQFTSAASNPLLAVLPPLLHIQENRGNLAGWLRPTLKMLAEEARNPQPGTEVIISRLTDIIFVQAVRAWIEEQPLNLGGWLGSLRDPQIGAALGLLHRETERSWTVAELAREVGMSRSPFAAKFTALVGEPPLTYLTNWRMHLAANMLSNGEHLVREVAARVGYESEASFSKAFKRAHAVSPQGWRQRKTERLQIAA